MKAEELESALGDPSDPEVTFSFRRAVELDEEEAFPAEAYRLLDDWKLPEYFIPASAGGKWRSTVTERAHGSDLLASDINNATRGTALSVIARVSA